MPISARCSAEVLNIAGWPARAVPRSGPPCDRARSVRARKFPVPAEPGGMHLVQIVQPVEEVAGSARPAGLLSETRHQALPRSAMARSEHETSSREEGSLGNFETARVKATRRTMQRAACSFTTRPLLRTPSGSEAAISAAGHVIGNDVCRLRASVVEREAELYRRARALQRDHRWSVSPGRSSKRRV